MGPIFQEILSDYPIRELFDIGCGNGHFTKAFLKDNKIEISGIDSNQYGTEKASENGFHKTNYIDDLCEAVYPWEKESFDFIICKDALEHLFRPYHVIEEARRILKKNGYFFILISNPFPIRSRV